MRLLKITVGFTVLSIALGIFCGMSPRVAALGWLLGTLLSLGAGFLYGLRASSPAALSGGAIAGGLPILIGCGLGAVLGPVTLGGLVAAVVVGIAAGAAASALSRAMISLRSGASAGRSR